MQECNPPRKSRLQNHQDDGPRAEPATASPWALKEHHIGLIDLPMP